MGTKSVEFRILKIRVERVLGSNLDFFLFKMRVHY